MMAIFKSSSFVSTFLVMLSFLFIIFIFEGEAHRHHNHHRHRHHHHNHASQEQESSLESRQGESEESENSSENTAVSSRLQRRLNILEQEVKYLCMEDEEDTERRIRHLGVKCICPQIEAPVCGSDHVTYHNRCYLHCHATHLANHTYHRYRITLKYFGPCEQEILSQSF